MAVKREERLRRHLENSMPSCKMMFYYCVWLTYNMDDYTDVKVAACCWKLLSWQAQKRNRMKGQNK